MADDRDYLLFLEFLDFNDDRSERVVLPRVNPYEEYDDKKFRERFRLSRRVALHLLSEVGKTPAPANINKIPYRACTKAQAIMSSHRHNPH